MLSLTTHPWWRRWFGSRSERTAGQFLRRLGYGILQHNFSCDLGEIDIIARDGNCVIFVEVRSTEAAPSASNWMRSIEDFKPSADCSGAGSRVVQ